MSDTLPTPEELRNLLLYEPETGRLFWRERPDSPRFNGKHSGKEALISCDSDGYRKGLINRRFFRAHRVIWAITHGEWPSGQIDHIDGNRSNNKLSNLRVVSNSGNQRNARRPKTNTSGRIGVYWHKIKRKWAAQMRLSGRFIHLGVFDRFEDASAAREKAELEHGFHKNHGRE